MSCCDLQILQHCAMAFTLQVVPTSKALQKGRQNSRSVHGMPNRNRLGTPSEHFSALSHCHTSMGFRMRWPQRCRCLPWSSTQDSSCNCKLRTLALCASNVTSGHGHWRLHDGLTPTTGRAKLIRFHYGYRMIQVHMWIQTQPFFGWSIWPIPYELRILILAATESDFETWYILLSGMSFCKSPEIRRNCCPCQTTKRAASQPQLKHATRMNIARQC